MDDPFEQISVLILIIQSVSLSGSIKLIGASLVMLVLLMCSALISGSEVAFFSLSPTDKETIESDKNNSNKLLLILLEKPKRLLATILISNNFVNISIVILSTYITDSIMGEMVEANVQFIVQVIVVTFLLLLLGEVIPKVYANKKPLSLANLMTVPTHYLSIFLSPLSRVLVSSTSFIDKRIKKRGHQISVDELSHALELTADENEQQEDQKILKGIVKFGNTEVKQIMTPRVDVLFVEEDASFDEVRKIIIDSGFSRIPIIKDKFDNIRGLLYIKDLLPHLDKKEMNWFKLARKPFFVPENKKIDDLLREFQGKKMHMAIVVDEYGGSSGIVSLEDILEEIVGDISDEFDDDELVYSKLDEFNFIFEAKILLNDFYRVLQIDGTEFETEKGESETLAGFVLELFGKIPKKNEKMRFNDYQITIDAADKRKIKRVKITLPTPS